MLLASTCKMLARVGMRKGDGTQGTINSLHVDDQSGGPSITILCQQNKNPTESPKEGGGQVRDEGALWK